MIIYTALLLIINRSRIFQPQFDVLQMVQEAINRIWSEVHWVFSNPDTHIAIKEKATPKTCIFLKILSRI
jgi:hypothetical protein